jgi:Collagen triple helix repeat (20 copies)
MLRGFMRYVRGHHVALLALFLALGGTSYAAASLINGSQIKPHSIPKNRLTQGAIASLHGAKGTKGTPGARGPTGAQGIPGQNGHKGTTGTKGPTGPAGLGSVDNIQNLPCTPEGATGEASVFYLSGGPSNPNDTSSSGSAQWQTLIACMTPDDLEPNNSKPAATDATDFIDDFGDRWAAGTIYPSGDEDWYKLTATDLSGGVIDLYTVTADTVMDVYEDNSPTPVAHDVYTYDPGPGAHDWLIRVHSTRPDFYFLALNDAVFSPSTGRPTSARLQHLVPSYERGHG